MSPKPMVVFVFLAVLLGSTASGEAQILNTLRGFDDDAPGWSGRVEGAVALAEGNTEYLELTLGATAQCQTGRQRWRLLGRNSRRTAGGVETAESRLGHLRHNYRLYGQLSSVVFVQGQYDPFRDLETRILVGVGGQVDLARNGGWNARVGATVMREDEKLTGSDRFRTTTRLSSFLSLMRKSEDGPNLDVSGFYQPALNDFGDARALLNAALEFDVVGDLFFSLNYALEFDSDPPGEVEETDHSLRSGLGYKL